MYEYNLADLKGYMKVDHNQDDLLIGQLASAAEAYLAGAGVLPETSPAALYQLAFYGLVLHWYDNRNVIAYYRSEIPLGTRQIINQLKQTKVVNANGGT